MQQNTMLLETLPGVISYEELQQLCTRLSMTVERSENPCVYKISGDEILSFYSLGLFMKGYYENFALNKVRR